MESNARKLDHDKNGFKVVGSGKVSKDKFKILGSMKMKPKYWPESGSDTGRMPGAGSVRTGWPWPPS